MGIPWWPWAWVPPLAIVNPGGQGSGASNSISSAVGDFSSAWTGAGVIITIGGGSSGGMGNAVASSAAGVAGTTGRASRSGNRQPGPAASLPAGTFTFRSGGSQTVISRPMGGGSSSQSGRSGAG